MVNAPFWARKRLGILPRYRTVPVAMASDQADQMRVPLDAGETLLGVYTNPAGSDQECVVVTSAAIVVGGTGRWARMAYADMANMRFRGGKDDWDVLTLVAADGRELAVHMPGTVEKPTTSLSTFLTKVSSARRVFDHEAIRVASARSRAEWAARVMAEPTPPVPQPVG